MNIAVMSDLHVGLASRAKDLCPEPLRTQRKQYDRFNKKSESLYREQFIQFVQHDGIIADYLVLPGDLTNQATPQEVQIASEFILQAADALHVQNDRIFFAPGNHDVDWSVYPSVA